MEIPIGKKELSYLSFQFFTIPRAYIEFPEFSLNSVFIRFLKIRTALILNQAIRFQVSLEFQRTREKEKETKRERERQ